MMKVVTVIMILFGMAIAGCATATKGDAAVVDNLKRYAALMRETDSNAWPPALVIDEGAEKLQKLHSGETTGSISLGFKPSDELRKYAELLRDLGRAGEAEEMEALAQWYTDCNLARFQGRPCE